MLILVCSKFEYIAVIKPQRIDYTFPVTVRSRSFFSLRKSAEPEAICTAVEFQPDPI